MVDWRRQGIRYKAAWRWVNDEALSVPWRLMPGGTILVEAPMDTKPAAIALYFCLSSGDQHSDLARQLTRSSRCAVDQNFRLGESLAEVGSGLNGRRRKLLRLLSNPKIGAIVVEHTT